MDPLGSGIGWIRLKVSGQQEHSEDHHYSSSNKFVVDHWTFWIDNSGKIISWKVERSWFKTNVILENTWNCLVPTVSAIFCKAINAESRVSSESNFLANPVTTTVKLGKFFPYWTSSKFWNSCGIVAKISRTTWRSWYSIPCCTRALRTDWMSVVYWR